LGCLISDYLTFFTTSPEPAPLLLLSIDNLQSFITFGYILRKVLETILSDKEIVLDPDATNRVVLVKELCVDIFCVFGIFEVDLFEGVAGEVTMEL
jgi:hypothetical protein